MTEPLIIGGDSLIGRELFRQYEQSGIAATATTRRTETLSAQRIWLDLSADVASWRPPKGGSVAFLCAAITSIEQCRADPSRARVTNVTNTLAVARQLMAAGYFVIFLSTNLVYDGTRPFREANERPCPITEYGCQKAEVEEALLQSEAVSVVRLTKVLQPEAALLVDWRDRLRRGEIVRPFSNVKFSPLPLSFASTVLRRVAERGISGIVHVSAKQDLTYEEAAAIIAESVDAKRSQVAGVPRSDAVEYSTLDIERLREELDMAPPDVRSTVLAAAGL